MRVHFIAIGGAVMHSLAIALARKGYVVSGSDDAIYEPSRSDLRINGLLPETLGWDVSRITPDIDAVILGMHALEDNPELLKAQELALRIYSYPEFIYEQAKEKHRVVIAGSHGKTTIISMVMHVLRAIGRDFDYLVGAKLAGFEDMVRLSKESPLMLIEGDEYFSSSQDKQPKFLHYHPNIALISEVSWDRMDVYPTLDDYVAQFSAFISSVEAKGTLVYNKDDKVLRDLVMSDHTKINKHGYAISEYQINKGVTYIHIGDEYIPLSIFGKHNLSNLSGALVLCEWLGISHQSFYDAIRTYRMAYTGLTYIASKGGSVVYQTMEVTPVNVQASILAMKEQFDDQELIVVVELSHQHCCDVDYLYGYHHIMNEADYAVVFINNKSSLKQVNPKKIDKEVVQQAFGADDLRCFEEESSLSLFLQQIDSKRKNLLFIGFTRQDSVNIINFTDIFFK